MMTTATMADPKPGEEEKTHWDEQRAGIRQGCHQDAVFKVGERHGLKAGSYAEMASKTQKDWIQEIIKVEELCVLRAAGRLHLKNQ